MEQACCGLITKENERYFRTMFGMEQACCGLITKENERY